MMLPPSLLLRPAADADAGFLQALYASTRDDLRQLPLPPAQLEQLIAMQQRAHEAGWRAAFPNAEVLVLEHDGMAAGKAVLDTTGHDWRLVELALLPVLRGRGLGTALLTALQARAPVRRQYRPGGPVHQHRRAAPVRTCRFPHHWRQRAAASDGLAA